MRLISLPYGDESRKAWTNIKDVPVYLYRTNSYSKYHNNLSCYHIVTIYSKSDRKNKLTTSTLGLSHFLCRLQVVTDTILISGGGPKEWGVGSKRCESPTQQNESQRAKSVFSSDRDLREVRKNNRSPQPSSLHSFSVRNFFNCTEDVEYKKEGENRPHKTWGCTSLNLHSSLSQSLP